jgi:hypothetical protein
MFLECVAQESKQNQTNNLNIGHMGKKMEGGSRKILIVGDSHCRKIAAELQHCLDSSF